MTILFRFVFQLLFLIFRIVFHIGRFAFRPEALYWYCRIIRAIFTILFPKGHRR